MALKSLHFSSFFVLFLFLAQNALVFGSENCHNSFFTVGCDDVYSAGSISGDQTVCLENNIPAPIVSLTLANNGSGEFEYLWIKTHSDPSLSAVVWLSIPGATGASYTPNALYETTWFRRCSRPLGCLSYGTETAITKIEVTSCVDPCEDFDIEVMNKIQPSCHDAEDGQIELSLIGGEAPFSVNWNGTNSSSLTASNLAKGYFTVEITDANGCYASKILTLNAPEAMKTSLTKKEVTCAGAADGTISLQLEGGTAPYTIYYNGIATTERVLENLSAGVYEIMVVDSKGCENLSTIEIFEPNPLSISIQTEAETCHQNDGQIYVDVIGGTAPYDFKWQNDETSADLTNVNAGNYTLMVSDKNQCLEMVNATVADDCGTFAIEFAEQMLTKMGENEVKINWMAYNETPNGVFLIERSLDGENFTLIGEAVKGEAFNHTGNQYFMMDDAPKNGMNHYRIRHFSQEGKENISEIAPLFFEREDMAKVSVFPNPVVEQVNFDFLKPLEEEVMITISDALGRFILSQTATAGSRFEAVDLSDFSAGNYFVSIEGDGQKMVKMVVKE